MLYIFNAKRNIYILILHHRIIPDILIKILLNSIIHLLTVAKKTTELFIFCRLELIS